MMNVMSSIAVDALAVVNMLVLLFSLLYKRSRSDTSYARLIIAVMVFTLFDMLYIILYGRSGATEQLILKTAKSLYFILNTAVICLWGSYVDSFVVENAVGRKKRIALYRIILAINSAFVAVNFFSEIMFGISDSGTFYVNTVGMWVFTAINYLCVVFVIVNLIVERKKTNRFYFIPFVIFPLIPMAAEIIQLFDRTISLVCAYSVSVLVMYQTSQSSLIYCDPLTRLGNRRMLYDTFSKFTSGVKGGTVSGVMLDIDGLKRVNDTYGHPAGDEVILKVAEIIRKSELRGVVSARYGGDEFVLVWDNSDITTETIKNRLESNKNTFNANRPDGLKIDFSVGAFSCKKDNDFTADNFMKEIDAEMYIIKNKKKATAATIK